MQVGPVAGEGPVRLRGDPSTRWRLPVFAAHIALAAVNELAIMIETADDRDRALREGQAAMNEFLDRLLAPSISG